MSVISSPFQRIKDHVTTFQLISDKEGWLAHFEKHYNDQCRYIISYTEEPVHGYRKNLKEVTMRYTTFQILATNNQLRVKRFAGLDDEYKWYHEIQILDQNQQVIETLTVSLDNSPNCFTTNETLIKGTVRSAPFIAPGLMYEPEIITDESLVTMTLLIPTKLPNYPEFRDEEGNAIGGDTIHNYFLMRIVINKEFIRDEFVTKELTDE